MNPQILFSILLVLLGGVLGVLALIRGYKFQLKIGRFFSFNATPPNSPTGGSG